MNLRKNALMSPVALATLALVGCGGGSDNNTQAAAPNVQAGETQNSKILVDGTEVQKTVYRVYSVADNKGTLTDTPLANVSEEYSLPHVLITESITKSTSAAPIAALSQANAMAYSLSAPIALPNTLAEFKTCYSQFWQGMQKHYPSKDKAFIAKRLNDFNMAVDELCVKQASSKLSMDEYIEMFQVVLKYWPNDPLIEGKVADFFMHLQVSPGTFKQTLLGLGYSWEDFARRLSNDNKGAIGFANSFEQSPLALEPFIKNYMTQQQPGPVVAMIQKKLQVLGTTLAKSLNPQLQQVMRAKQTYAQTTPTIDVTAKQYTDAIKSGVEAATALFTLAKDVWAFIDPGDAALDINTVAKDGGQKVSNYIISGSELSTLGYEYAKPSQTKVVTFLGDSWRGVAYKVDMRMEADYGATNLNAPGQWIPNFGLVVTSATADKGYKIAGSARVSNVVNRGSNAAPIPEAQIDVTMTANNWDARRENFSFIVNGASGALFKN